MGPEDVEENFSEVSKRDRKLFRMAISNVPIDAIKGPICAALKEGANLNAKNGLGETPLHWAVQMGRSEVVRFFIDKGANPNGRTKNGGTPLHWAASKGDVDVAEVLISNGADPNAINKENRTPCDVADLLGHRMFNEAMGDIHRRKRETSAIRLIAEDTIAAVLKNLPEDYKGTFLAETIDRFKLRNAVTEALRSKSGCPNR